MLTLSSPWSRQVFLFLSSPFPHFVEDTKTKARLQERMEGQITLGSSITTGGVAVVSANCLDSGKPVPTAVGSNMANSSSSLFRTVASIKDEYSYSEEDLIGRGAFSTVFKAKKRITHSGAGQQSHEPQFALKIIIKKKLEEKTQIREVEREVSVLQNLRHSGCTCFVEALQSREEYCIVMLFVEGSVDVSKYMRTELEGQPLRELHVALVAFQLLSTIDYLHSTFRLLHRDIKLENILLSPLTTTSSGTSTSAPSKSGDERCGVAGVSEADDSDKGCKPSHDNKVPPLPFSNTDAIAVTSGGVGGGTLSGPSQSSSIGGMDQSGGSGTDVCIDETIAARCKVTLLDFGLSRWVGKPALWPSSSIIAPCAVTSPAPMPSSNCRDGTASPVTPSMLGSFPNMHHPFPFDPVSSSSSSSPSSILQLTPCGTDRYMPSEMLKWVVEHEGLRKPSSLQDAKKLDSYSLGIVIYVMLCAHFPFSGKSKAALAAQQISNPPRCNAAHWQQISPAARSFVQGLLKCDVSERLSIEQALGHEWIKTLAEPLAKKLGLRPQQMATIPTAAALAQQRIPGDEISTSSRSSSASDLRSGSPSSLSFAPAMLLAQTGGDAFSSHQGRRASPEVAGRFDEGENRRHQHAVVAPPGPMTCTSDEGILLPKKKDDRQVAADITSLLAGGCVKSSDPAVKSGGCL